MSVTFRYSGDRMETFELPETSSNAPSCFLIGMWKGGSTLMAEIMRDLAPFCVRQTFELPRLSLSRGLPISDILEDCTEVFQRPGYVFGVFRGLPENDLLRLSNHMEGKAGRTRFLFLVRDPRDALVSLYHSHAKSHAIPKDGPLQSPQEELRENLNDEDIDSYVRAQAPHFLRHYCRTMQVLAMPDVTVLRYEDIIYDKLVLVRAIADIMGAEATPEQFAEIATRHDVTPDRENPSAHTRLVHPGNYRDQLTPDTIQELNTTLAHVMDRFGYEVDEPGILDASVPMPLVAQPRSAAEAHSEPELVIHIGLPKTGTKALQMGFKATRDILYLQTPGSGKIHSRAFSNYVGVGKDVLDTHQFPAFHAEMLQEMKSSPHRLRVVSDETLCLINRIDWERFAALLRDCPGRIRFVMVVRPFFSWLESLLTQFAKNGNLEFHSFRPGKINAIHGYPLDFLRIYSAYSALCEQLDGRADITVLPYERDMEKVMSTWLQHPIETPEDATYAHRSMSSFVALAQFLQGKGLVERMPRRHAKFLGRNEVDVLHRKHSGWMNEMTTLLGWAPEMIDDYDSFARTLETFSYISWGRRQNVTPARSNPPVRR